MNTRLILIYVSVLIVSPMHSMDNQEQAPAPSDQNPRSSLHEVFAESGRLEQQAKEMFENQKKSELLKAAAQLKQEWQKACAAHDASKLVELLQTAVSQKDSAALEDSILFLANEQEGVKRIPDITHASDSLALAEVNTQLINRMQEFAAGSDCRTNIHIISNYISRLHSAHTHNVVIPEGREIILTLKQDHKRKQCTIL